jgi:hypothetical protein
LGLTKTTYVMGGLLLVTPAFQFMARKYEAAIYWLAVVLLSIVGTLITDNLTDNFGISPVTTTVIFATRLAATFGAWYATEKTLSIHATRICAPPLCRGMGKHDAIRSAYLAGAVALVPHPRATCRGARRGQLFFKLATGFGSKAAYRGDKLTHRVWDQIRCSAAPSCARHRQTDAPPGA